VMLMSKPRHWTFYPKHMLSIQTENITDVKKW